MVNGFVRAWCCTALIGILAPIFWRSAVPALAQAGPGPLTVGPLPVAPVVQQSQEVDKPLPRIICPEGFEVSIYAAGLQSPDGLAFGPDGALYVAEEAAGRVSRIDPGGDITPVATDVASPEGITFDRAGNLYITEDVENGRLVRVDSEGGQTVLASDLDAPEGVVWSPGGFLYVTESNAQFADNLPWDVVSGVTRVSQDSTVTTVFTDTVLWSFSEVAQAVDGLLSVGNEASNEFNTHSILRVDPITGARTVFASDLTAVEGLAFSPGGVFPLFAVEEDVGDGQGRLSLVRSDGTHIPLCTGFGRVESVAVDGAGRLYVSEDENGLIVQIVPPPDITPPGPPQKLVTEPQDWTATNAFTLTWENPSDSSDIAGAYLKLGDPPAFVTDGTFYAGEELVQIGGITVTRPGAHVAHVWVEDGAGSGNADHRQAATTTLFYDPEPPGSPLGLSVEPNDWTATDAFTLTWTNPPELSGVTTACYRLNTSPVDKAGFDACQASASINMLTDMTVSTSGEHPVYVWLADAAGSGTAPGIGATGGNSDPSTAVSITLRHDALAPVSVAIAPTTTHVAPIQVSWVATDTHSGVDRLALWVKAGEEGTWAESGLTAQADSPGFFLYPPAGQGAYYFATVAVDQAGNAEAKPTGEGEAQTFCETWQRVYLPLVWKYAP
jgi:sugar lactone lactonase YvrE